MNKKAVYLIFSFFVYSFCFAQTGSNETVTVATYYPSPYGVYNEMRANSMVVGETNASSIAAPSAGAVTFKPLTLPPPVASEGTFYYDSSDHVFKYQDNTASWKSMGGMKAAFAYCPGGASPATPKFIIHPQGAHSVCRARCTALYGAGAFAVESPVFQLINTGEDTSSCNGVVWHADSGVAFTGIPNVQCLCIY